MVLIDFFLFVATIVPNICNIYFDLLFWGHCAMIDYKINVYFQFVLMTSISLTASQFYEDTKLGEGDESR